MLEARFNAVGGETMSVPADKLDGFIRTENDMWTKLIKESGINSNPDMGNFGDEQATENGRLVSRSRSSRPIADFSVEDAGI